MNSSIDDLSLERDDCLRCACRSLNRASERERGGRLGVAVVRRSGFTHFFFLSPLPPFLSRDAAYFYSGVPPIDGA